MFCSAASTQKQRVQLDEQRVQLDEQRVQLDEQRVQLDEQRVQSDEQRVQLHEQRVHLDDQEGQLDEQQVQLDKQRVQLDRQQVQLDEQEDQLDEQRVQLCERRVQLDDQRVQLDKQRVQSDEQRVQLDDQRVLLDQQRVQLEETRVQLGETQTQLRVTQKTTRKLEDKLEALQRQIERNVTTVRVMETGGSKQYFWKIKDFSEILRQAKEKAKERIESDPFYTGPCGYKLKVFANPYRSYWRAGSSSLHLSIGIILMEGEHDDKLTWPFNRKITITVIDQNRNLKQRQNVTDYLSPSRQQSFYIEASIFSAGRPGVETKSAPEGQLRFFMSHETLRTRRYIENDTLVIQVDVDADA